MEKNDILNSLHKNIKDLDFLSASFMEMNTIPASLLQMFEDKLKDVVRIHLQLKSIPTCVSSSNEEVETNAIKAERKIEIPTPTLEAPSTTSWGEQLGKTTISSLGDSISINDRFLFQRELFANDPVLFASMVNQIDKMDSYAEVQSLLNNQFQWNKDDEYYLQFDALIQRRFNI